MQLNLSLVLWADTSVCALLTTNVWYELYKLLYLKSSGRNIIQTLPKLLMIQG